MGQTLVWNSLIMPNKQYCHIVVPLVNTCIFGSFNVLNQNFWTSYYLSLEISFIFYFIFKVYSLLIKVLPMSPFSPIGLSPATSPLPPAHALNP